jgi:hypothetical protein
MKGEKIKNYQRQNPLTKKPGKRPGHVHRLRFAYFQSNRKAARLIAGIVLFQRSKHQGNRVHNNAIKTG